MSKTEGKAPHPYITPLRREGDESPALNKNRGCLLEMGLVKAVLTGVAKTKC